MQFTSTTISQHQNTLTSTVLAKHDALFVPSMRGRFITINLNTKT